MEIKRIDAKVDWLLLLVLLVLVLVLVLLLVVNLFFLNNNYCWQPEDVPFSPIAPKLLFLNKKMIILFQT